MVLLAIIVENVAFAADLLLELEEAIEERLGSRGASGDVNVDGDDAIAAAHDSVGVVVVATTVSTASHRNHIARLREKQ